MMFESLEMIQRRDLPLMSLLSKYEWNLLGKCPASDLKVSRADVMDVEDKEDVIYSQHYLVTMSTNSMA